MHPPDAGVRQLAVSSDGLALAVGTKRGGLAVVDLHTPELSLVAPPLPAAHESESTGHAATLGEPRCAGRRSCYSPFLPSSKASLIWFQ